MRKLFLSLLMILPLLTFGILILKNQNTNPQKSAAKSPPPVLSAENQNNQYLKMGNYAISWFEVDNINSLLLIPNFSEKISSKEIINQNNCKFLSNGPFYAKNSQPLGLFIANGKSLANWQQNSLFDGILSVNDMATPRITRDVPQDNLRIAIQTGPILKENNTFQTLNITNDSNSRRVVAGVDGNNKLFFLVVYDPASEFSGPFLVDLPNVLSDFEQKSGVSFADIINLDGGSASTFNSQNVSLSELSSVGAFFCLP